MADASLPHPKTSRSPSYDQKDDQLIIKCWRESEDDGYIVLYYAKGVTIVRPQEDPELIFRGEVVWRGGGL